ncbi:MAG: NADH:ubiquinone oxidoreductase subunit [Mycobacterium sp.]|nr:NADH:ubiquinone oxidoreductase subunit [Mycobacterium sp.]
MTSDSLLLAEAFTRTSTSEAVAFWILGAIALVGAIGVVAAAKAVYSALFLAATMIALAMLYVAQDALFLGVVQVVVYTGAVMMLFLFVLMLIGVDSSESLVETIRGQRIAALIFTRYLWAFEVTSALLITAALGAMVLAHRERFERRKTQRELAIERFQPGGYPTTLPSSGVYARHNAVDMPARLPDGSPSMLSVSSILSPRTTEDAAVDNREGPR